MNRKKIVITVFRMAIGWHFLYEGIAKIVAGNWSATSYLINSTGPFSEFYHWMGSSEALMQIIDPVNMAVLILIGLGLFIGLAINISAISGITLLLLYYFAYPPFGGSIMGPVEGNLFIVNKNIIEALALLIFILSREKGFGLYALSFFKINKSDADVADNETDSVQSRRSVLKNLATLPALGIIGFGAFHNSKEFGVDTNNLVL